MRHLQTCAWLLIASMFLAACAPTYGGGTYTGQQTRQAQTVQWGTIESISPATIQNSPSGLGLLGGAVVGGLLGNMVGGGKGRTLATIGGALGGAAAGYGAEKAMDQTSGIEITVRLDNGQTIAVVQQPDEQFSVGERVRVLTSPDGSARVRY